MQLVSASPALLGAFLALALSSGSVPAQTPIGRMVAISLPAPHADATLAPIEFHGERLQLLMEELQRESPTAAAMLYTVRKLGFPITVGTFVDLAQEMEQEYSSWTRSSRSAAGYMAPVVRPGPQFTDRLTTVKINVAVNLSLLDELFEQAPRELPDARVSWDEIRRLETLAVLAHELVHAHGLALAGGDPRFGCHDPHEGESTRASCVMIGENLIRREIGAPLDWDYGFPSAPGLVERYTAVAARKQALDEIATYRLPHRAEALRTPARKPIGR